ncbi:MAG: alpha/beta hydrolase [Nitrososphaerota archaeon]|nr:alpha/beta hydrolase [Nitrososphaerota archaeon]
MEAKTLQVNGCKCQALIHKAKGTPIVFLHVLSYNLGVRQRIGVTEFLAEKQVSFLALDMPYRLKSPCQPKNPSPQKNIDFVAKTYTTIFGETAPVVVSASLGGYIALKYATQHKVKGLFLIAPAHAFDDEALVKAYRSFDFPVHIVWGTNDTVISGEEMRTLTQKLPNAKMLTYSGAAHLAYQDYPEWFKRDLLMLYASADTT